MSNPRRLGWTALLVAAGLGACGSSKLGNGGSAGAASSGGTGGSAGTSGAVGVGGSGGSGGCVWPTTQGDPQPGPLTCGADLPFGVAATIEGAQIKLVFKSCDPCSGDWACINFGHLTAVHVEVEGSWATVVDEGFASPCPVFTAHLLPASADSEGLIHVTGSFSGVDVCQEPLSCPIDKSFMFYRGSDGAVTIGPAGSIEHRCSVSNVAAGSCGGMSFACGNSFQQRCRQEVTGDCAPTWSAALADTFYCAYGGAVTFPCGAYNVRVGVVRDASYASYYDASSGALVAGISSDAFGSACYGGPAQFIAPSCPSANPQSQSCPPGSDAGTP